MYDEKEVEFDGKKYKIYNWNGRNICFAKKELTDEQIVF